MQSRLRWVAMLSLFALVLFSPVAVLEISAAGPYEYLVLNQSEAGALNLDTIQITDNSTGTDIDVRGEYVGTSVLDPSRGITFTAHITLISPTDDISFETALANCSLCANPGWGNCRPWGVGFENPCLSRFEDGYINFGAYGIDRNRCWFGGTTVFSANGLKITITSEKLDYGLTQALWDEVKRRHDEFANLTAHKIRTTYDPLTMTLTLNQLNNPYAPGETVTLNGSIANTFDSAPLANAGINIDVDGTLFTTTSDAAGNFNVQFDIAAGVGSLGAYPIIVTVSLSGYPDTTETTSLTVEEIVPEVTVNTDKASYAPGDTVIIQGHVTERGNGVPGVPLNLNISGSILTTTTDGSGGYRVEFQVPADTVLQTFDLTVTAIVTATSTATNSTTFTVVTQALTVAITTDKDHYLIDDAVHCTIEISDDASTPVPDAGLTVTRTYLASGRKTNSSGASDALGENLWTFTWGKDAGNKIIEEGRLKIEVTATKTGYADGYDTITLSGCGDLIHDGVEDCLDCEEDCACGPAEVCDPSSDYKDSATMCGPKVACIFISRGLGWYHEWWASDDIKWIRKYYQKKGYTVTPDIYVNEINDVAKYLSRPSTKAIAYTGHSAGGPKIEETGSDMLPDMIQSSNRSAGSFLYRCQFESYAAKWVDAQDKIKAIANEKINHPNLDYVFMFSCYSLDDYSLRDYLLKSGGTYWGHYGKLPGHSSLTEIDKP